MQAQQNLESQAERLENLAERLQAEGKETLAREARLEAARNRALARQLPERLNHLRERAEEAERRAAVLKEEKNFRAANEASADAAILRHRIAFLEG